MGVYLPMALTLLIPVGAALGHLYERWAKGTANPEFAQRMGVLMATGLIVGESLFGVAFAGIVAGSGSDAPLGGRRRAFRDPRHGDRRACLRRRDPLALPPHEEGVGAGLAPPRRPASG